MHFDLVVTGQTALHAYLKEKFVVKKREKDREFPG